MTSILINRAPVLTLWAAIVAERLGHDRATALTLGRAVAGLNAQSKGQRLGIFEAPAAKSEKPPPKAPRTRARTIPLLGRAISIAKTPDGLRAVIKQRREDPAAVEQYLAQKFGSALPPVEAAMRRLAKAYPRRELASLGYSLYEQFRPAIPEGVQGWGAKGRLDLESLERLGKERHKG